jgi:Na+:H+ antiporter, NhaA family
MLRLIRSALSKIRSYPTRIGDVLEDFHSYEASGAMTLLGATVLALVIANTPLRGVSEAFWQTHVGISVGHWEISKSLVHWVNDGLMALFFFVVGLEVKREVVVGELKTARQAALPLLAAIGGMVVPIGLYLALNTGREGAGGWGVPMATDIAFALGVLALLGSRAPSGLRVFLTALAIGDDIGAIVVIAVAYTSSVAWIWLALALLSLLALLLLNALGIDSSMPYWVVGLFVWICFLNSGVHSTLAGVLVALTIPTTSRCAPMEFVEQARAWLLRIASIDVEGEHVLVSDDQQHLARELQVGARWMQAPLQRMEHAMLPVTTYVVLPLFALANAGVSFTGNDAGHLLLGQVSLGVVLGLVVGKPIGIIAMTWLAVRLRIADLPTGVTWRHIVGVGVLGGIGFTVSLFIAGLAFEGEVLPTEAKLAILAASVVSGLIGWLILRSAAEAPAVVGE